MRLTMRVPTGLLALPLMLAGCGGARAAVRDFPVQSFDRISNATPFDVHVRVGGAPAVRAEGTEAALAHLQVVVAGGTLAITSRPGVRWENGRVPQWIEVTAPRLAAIAVDGPGDVTVDAVRADRLALRLNGPGKLTAGRMDVRDLAVELHGPGDVRLAGRAGRATLTLDGPGDVSAPDLMVRDAIVSLNGPGDLVVGATGTVTGTLNGPGSITVHGGARCRVDRHGPGEVNCR